MTKLIIPTPVPALALVLIALAGTARAQIIEFRIVEKSPTASGTVLNAPPSPGTTLTSVAPVGNYAVQARMTGGLSLGGFSFDIVIPGEADGLGTLAKLRIMDGGFNYYTGVPSLIPAVGFGGMAKQYTSLATINSGFNGSINTSFGTFTNIPSQQEIGQINGLAADAPLLAMPLMDSDSDGNPDTWPNNGTGIPPVSGDTAPLDPTLAGLFFARGNAFVDIYRFRYTTTNFTSRVVNLTLANVAAQSFTQFAYTTSWGAQNTPIPAGAITVTPLVVGIGSQGTCCDTTGACSFGNQTACPPGGQWTVGGTCSPSPCLPPAACCHGATCTVTTAFACTGGNAVFIGTGSVCNPLVRGGTMNACCPADYDHNGAMAVADVFAFLNAWFSGCP